MAKPLNIDGTPRKKRADCKFFLLPDEGKVAFAKQLEAQPNVEQLQAIAAGHGVEWSAKNIYEFIKGPRRSEAIIQVGVILNRQLGESLAAAGADKLTTDSRRLATGYWMTAARCATEQAEGKRSGEDDAAYTVRLARSREEMDLATKNLIGLGCLKAGEDKGALNLAKLAIDREKLAQAERKLKIFEGKLQAISDATKSARDKGASLSDTDRQEVLDRVDEIMGVRKTA